MRQTEKVLVIFKKINEKMRTIKIQSTTEDGATDENTPEQVSFWLCFPHPLHFLGA
jgi:hypothetical protein